MQRASSVERLGLAMALAQLWCVSLGCQAEARRQEQVQHTEPGASVTRNPFRPATAQASHGPAFPRVV